MWMESYEYSSHESLFVLDETEVVSYSLILFHIIYFNTYKGSKLFVRTVDACRMKYHDTVSFICWEPM